MEWQFAIINQIQVKWTLCSDGGDIEIAPNDDGGIESLLRTL